MQLTLTSTLILGPSPSHPPFEVLPGYHIQDSDDDDSLLPPPWYPTLSGCFISIRLTLAQGCVHCHLDKAS